MADGTGVSVAGETAKDGSTGVIVSVEVWDGVIVSVSSGTVADNDGEFGSGRIWSPNTVINAAKIVAKKPIQATTIGTDRLDFSM